MSIKTLDELFELAKQKPTRRLVVAFGQDKHTIHAVKEAIMNKLVQVTLVGNENVIIEECGKLDIDPKIFEIVNEPDEWKAGKKAVYLINEGKGDILMKGLISTDKYLRCILDKKEGLMIPKATLTHITLVEAPAYDKLMVASDCAFIPQPDINQKIAMTQYVIDTARELHIDKPKVALISFTEKANPKVASTVDAAVIAKMGDRGQLKNAKIDGPLALDVAVDPESVKIKKLNSCVEGKADCLVFPNLEAGNVFYKTLTKLAGATMATYVAGSRVPAILPSRGDNEKSKLYSIALCCLLVK
ncbi:MAG: phosphate acyltransferase [Candidatus Cloacimonadota bacterium]|nr:phosphate acyltransferase [Candidatus Cloacimonadota bacterium]